MEVDEIKAWRREERRRLRAERMAVPPAERRALQERLAERLPQLVPELADAVVAFYWPFKGEPDLRPLMEALHARGAAVALPAVVDEAGPLEFRAWQPGACVEPGVWNIPVPVARELVQPGIAIVPLVGFDAAGYRLGNGGGYYDRTLAALQPRPVAIGVGHSLGRLASIHPQPHDIPMDLVVTEAGEQWARPGGDGGAEDPASPVCYASEAPAAYAGYLAPEELQRLLITLLEGTRAHARAAAHLAAAEGWPAPAVDALTSVRRDTAAAGARLRALLGRLGADPSTAAGPLEGRVRDTADPRRGAALLADSLHWAVRTTQESLPQIADNDAHGWLRRLVPVLEACAHRCEAMRAL